jgi:hypothetical protein
MSARLLLTLMITLAAIVEASDNSVEVTLEDTPSQNPPPHWKFRPDSAAQDSDSQGVHWRSKFYAGSDKRLGTLRDAASIKRLVPSSMPITIRWISRSVVVVAADCYFDASSRGRFRCLYVLEKHGSKWTTTHHYSHRLPTI